MARQYFLELPEPQTERTHFIARRQSYHGNTLGSLSVGGHFGRRAPYKPLLTGNVSHVSPCYAYRGKMPGESDGTFVARLAQELEDEFQAVGPSKVCAFVAETVSGTVSRPASHAPPTDVRLIKFQTDTRLRPSGTGILPSNARSLRPARGSPHYGRSDVRDGAVRNPTRLGAGRGSARLADGGQGTRGGLRADRGATS